MDGVSFSEGSVRGLHPSVVAAVRVAMPPAWDGSEPTPYTLIFVGEEVDAGTMCALYRGAARARIPNPRVLTPATATLSSLYHPLLFANVARGPFAAWAHAARPTRPTAQPVATVRSWLQSLLFLAGVTLSAAIVQDRWSRGTVRSKLLRLWQAGGVARRHELAALASLDLEGAVRRLAAAGRSERETLLELKHVYGEAIAALVDGMPAEPRRMHAVAERPPRFDFVPALRARLGDNLRAVIAYGSSVTSPDYADYDLVLVVGDAAAALRELAGTRPQHAGRELNMSVHGERDFQTYQLASGDNLSGYGLCLDGEVDVPFKPREDLLHRNLSFGLVRMRQIMGMAAATQLAPLADDRDDKHNLHGYFVKIPLNVYKGTYGVTGALLAKADVSAALRGRLGYDVEEMTAWCHTGRAGDALATAAWCTQALMLELNHTFALYTQGREHAV